MEISGSVLVIGLGSSGKAVVDVLLRTTKAIVHGVDGNPALFQGDPAIESLVNRGAYFYPDTSFVDVTLFNLIVTSPGVPTTHPLLQQALQHQMTIIGEAELACRLLAHHKMVAITGTNGKTTVTLLVAHILNHAGMTARAVGNVGIPLISQVLDNNSVEVLVVELSSYQLETMDTPIFDGAVILNITPDHLDRYPSMDAYAAAKWRIAHCLKSNAICYIEEQTALHYAHLALNTPCTWQTYGFSPNAALHTDGRQLFLSDKILFDLPPPYHGRKNHDVENLLATYALCHTMGVKDDQFIAALDSFSKPPHRIEFVAEKQGVKFIDDSKGTNIDAVIKAVHALRAESSTAQIFLIAGGVDKGSSYVPWLNAFQGSVCGLYVIGQAAEKIRQELGHAFPTVICQTLEEATQAAASKARCGDYVLLSPGCSSFDMFRDYAHRGEEFKKIVNQL